MGEHGCLRRRITLRQPAPHRVTGRVQDDVHEFVVTIDHRDGLIETVSAEAHRFPWTTCPGAVYPLRHLEGQSLFRRAGDVGQRLKMSINCTHMFELAGLVVAHAARGAAPDRIYEAVVPDRKFKSRHQSLTKFEAGEAFLSLNQQPILRWLVEEPYILEPLKFAGRSLSKGFREWTDGLADDDAEAALILRRAVHVAGGRETSLQTERASEMEIPAVCHSFQPENVNSAFNTYTKRDFAGGIPNDSELDGSAS